MVFVCFSLFWLFEFPMFLICDIWIILMLMPYSVFFISQIWVKFTKRLIKLSLRSGLNIEKPLKASRKEEQKQANSKGLSDASDMKALGQKRSSPVEFLPRVCSPASYLITWIRITSTWQPCLYSQGQKPRKKLDLSQAHVREDNHDHRVEISEHGPCFERIVRTFKI